VLFRSPQNPKTPFAWEKVRYTYKSLDLARMIIVIGCLLALQRLTPTILRLELAACPSE
jgi:hypothetical protein